MFKQQQGPELLARQGVTPKEMQLASKQHPTPLIITQLVCKSEIMNSKMTFKAF